jgi:signal transduction histidine kinase
MFPFPHRHRHRMRGRFQRRLFLWFGASILAAGLAVALVTDSRDRSGSSWQEDVRRVRAFASNQFARVWDRPAERDALAQALARDLDFDVVLTGADGAMVGNFGARRCERPSFRIPVQRDGAVLGSVAICADRHRFGRAGPGFFFLIFGVLGVLWASTGWIARRLSRPLVELTQVAQDLGAGRLSTRYQLHGPEHGEVRVLADAFNDMAARIEKQIRDQRELLAAVSHELRTPLGHIRLLAELAREGGAAPKALDELDREVVEMDALVGQLLAHARLDFATLSLTRLDAAELAVRALERSGLEGTRLVVEAEQTAFEGDATLVARAISNLIDNARKHGRGLETLRVKGRAGFVSFEAEDRGDGFGPGEEVRAFDAFYRKPKGTERDSSLGLGLALVKRTAEAHGGTAWARNREGGGACVGFELPLAATAALTEAPRAAARG